MGFSLTNSCAFTTTASGPFLFQVAPTENGPWTSPIHVDYFNFSVPPGTSNYNVGGLWNGPLPEGNYFWRASMHVYGQNCWSLQLDSPALPACVVSTATPTATTPTTPTRTATPTCCRDVTGAVTSSCDGTLYYSAYTITNSCSITQTANGWWQFEVSPNSNGPWRPTIVGDCFSCAIPPGTNQYGGSSINYGPLPQGNNWWRIHIAYSGIDGCWRFDVASDPQPACALPTATATVTPIPVFVYH